MKMEKDHQSNLTKALHMIEKAAEKGAKIVCLPELFSSLYFPQDQISDEKPCAIPNFLTDALSKGARENKVIVVGGSLYEKSGTRSYNTSVVFDDNGRILGKYRKVHVPQDPNFYEQDYFSRGNRFEVFETKYCKIGILICFDQWYPEAARIERLMGADIVFYPTAIGRVDGIDPVEGDWRNAWENVQIGHAISNSVVVASVNRVGREGAMTFWGSSFVSDQFGTILVKGDQRKEEVLIADCDLELGNQIEKGWGFLRNRMPRLYEPIESERKHQPSE